MLSKCANPSCFNTFLYLHDGRLFQLETSHQNAVYGADFSSQKLVHHTEFFWLCGKCATKMTVVFEKGIGAVVKPLTQGPSAHAA